MAEKTEPRMGLILLVATLSIVGFVLLRWAMISYFWMETDAEEYVKYQSARPEQRLRLRTAQVERLQNGPVPIDQAMHLVAAGTRPAVIEPRPSTDIGPLQGWSQRPTGYVAPAAPTPPPAPSATPPAAPAAPAPAGGAAAPAPAAPSAPAAPVGLVPPHPAAHPAAQPAANPEPAEGAAH